MKPIIFGFLGKEVTPEEKAFFNHCDPLGFIFFKRNVVDRDQVRRAIADLREAVGREAPIFIDQEGGRVTRLKPPVWKPLCSMGKIGAIYAVDPQKGRMAIRLHTRLMAHRLFELGIIGDFAPVLDLRIEGASDVIGDRSFGRDPSMIAELGRIACDTFLANGVLPCIKHLPAHGRMVVDPHQELPTVTTPLATLRAEDFRPFQALNDCPLGMTSHGVFPEIDPDLPVSISPKAHRLIREELGFKGLIVTDDLAMKALSPSYGENARLALTAGSDIALYCWGKMEHMLDIDSKIEPMSPELLSRWAAALKLVKTPAAAYDPAPDEDRLAELEKLAV